MVKKKALTLDDLVLFCRQNNFGRFSAKESGYQLAVQVPTTFEVEEDPDDSHRGMLRLKFRILHDGLNRNGSFVSHKAAEKASKTIADRPIMAAIHKLDDGSYDFEAHEMEIVENESGEHEINYIEKQVGSFSSEKPFWEHDDELDKDYLCAYGYIAEEYTKAADIIRSKGWTKNSCELTIEEMSVNAKEKYLELDSFYLSASTLLGAHDDGTQVQEGMLGSRADIADFSEKNNSIFSNNDKVIELLSALNEKLDNLNIEKSLKEGGSQSVKKEFNEVTEAEVKETPSAKFDDEPDFYDEEGGDGEEGGGEEEPTPDLSDNPPAADDPTPDPNATPDPNEGGGSEEGGGGDDEGGDDEGGDDEGGDDDEPSGIPLGQKDDDDTAGGSKKLINSIEYAVTIDGVKKEYAVTLKDKLVALSTLINDSYGEADGCYYDVDADEDTKTVIFHDYWNDKHYRQLYTVKKGVYSLKGDRTEVFATYLSKDEIDALENMKANYSSTVEELAQYKAEPEKLEILAEKCYSQIADTDAYKKLSERETYFSMSVDEVRAEADKILLEFAKGHKVEFSAKEDGKKAVGFRQFGDSLNKESKKGKYGGIFKK